MVNSLPDGTFVSYSYQDKAGLQALLACLPLDAHLRIFEPILVSPYEYVSTPLIEAIREAPALVCIRSEPQQASPWTALECEIAFRARKPVFVFNPKDGAIHEHRGRPSTVSIHDVSPAEETSLASDVMTWMAEHRGFELEDFNPRRFDMVREYRYALESYRGLFLAFVRPSTGRNTYMHFVRIGCEEIVDEEDNLINIHPGLVLACLEPPGPWIPREWDPYIVEHGKIDLSDERTAVPWSRHRVDDLMVLILWHEAVGVRWGVEQ
jgi:hypothetical protein